LADASGGTIALDPLPAPVRATLAPDLPEPHRLAALPPPEAIAPAWNIVSYSSLVHGAAHEAAARDHDLRSQPVPEAGAADTLAADDILRFPRGAAAGDCLHALFEAVDFGASASWTAAIERVLAQHAAALPADTAAPQRAAMLARLLDDTLNTELPGGIVLARLPQRRRLTEMEFHLPARGLSAGALDALLHEHGYAAPSLGADRLAGYLRGFVDLVFEHAGRYYLLDWKSNHLGDARDDYAPAAVQKAMDAHGYHLQYLLYTLALHRHLRLRLDDYSYARHFGGVLYLFVRGVRPGWRDADGHACGVYAHRPEPAAIDALARLFSSEGA
jgi:exodeoxyribonuclease V beta subunit